MYISHKIKKQLLIVYIQKDGKEIPLHYPSSHLNLDVALSSIPKELLTTEVVARIGRCQHKRVNWKAFSNIKTGEDLNERFVLNNIF